MLASMRNVQEAPASGQAIVIGSILAAWHEAGFAQRTVHGAHSPFELLPLERREAVLTVAGLIAQRLTTGALAVSARSRDSGASLPLLRPPPRVGPDMLSKPPSAHDPVADAIAAARADPREAYRIRRFVLRREHVDDIPEIDARLIELGFPIVTTAPEPLAEARSVTARPRQPH